MSENVQTIHGEKLEALTGLTDRRHRQLAKAGYFPSPVRGMYQLVATLRGMFNYYRELLNESADDKLKLVRRQLLEDKLARIRGELVKTDELRLEVSTAIVACKARILALAEVCKVELGLTDAQAETVAVRVREALDELSRIKWNSPTPIKS